MSISGLPALSYSGYGLRTLFIDTLAAGESNGQPGVGMADVDEAAHALYALSKNSGTGVLRDHANRPINDAMHGHLIKSLADEPLDKSKGDLFEMFMASALTSGAAYMAIKAGHNEYKESKEQAKDFPERGKYIAEEKSLTQGLNKKSQKDLKPLIHTFHKATDSRVGDNTKFADAAHLGGMIGKYSFLSGAAIMARIGIELVRNVGGAAISGTSDVHSAAKDGALTPNFLVPTGLASNALAALASAFAVMLGYNFVKKTNISREKWRKDSSDIKKTNEIVQDPNSAYGTFLEAKAQDRLKFSDAFHRKNRMFLVGSALYATGTILPTCVKLLAAAGVLSSKKVGANLILGLFATGIAGALIMGLYSRQFFYGHPKLERYEEYALKDSPDLDRRFLANIDAFAFKNEKGVIEPAEYSVKQGYEMRAAIFDFFQGREKLRSTFVEVIAQTTGRKYTAPSHIGDQDYVRHSLSEKIRARFRKDRLRTTDIEEWLKTPENQTKVTTLFTHITRNKITLLTQKAKLQGAMHSQIMGGTNNGPPAPTDITDFKERAEFAEAMCSSYDKTIERIAEHNRALKRLQHIATSSGNFAEAIESVMALDPSGDDEKAKDVAKSEPLERRLAAYLIEDMPAQYNHNRGKLLEIEAQASKHAQHHFRPIPR